MPETCKASFQFTVDEMSDAMDAHYSSGMRNWLRWSVTLFFSLFLLLLIAGLAVMMLDERDDSGSVPGFILAAVAAIVILAFINGKGWWWMRKFRSQAHVDANIHWEFDESAVRTWSELGESTMSWKLIPKIIVSADGFLFYPFKNIFFWIPFSAFESQACVESVRNFATQNGCRIIERK